MRQVIEKRTRQVKETFKDLINECVMSVYVYPDEVEELAYLTALTLSLRPIIGSRSEVKL